MFTTDFMQYVENARTKYYQTCKWDKNYRDTFRQFRQRFLSFNSYKLILDFPVKVQTSIQMTIDSQKHV